MSRSESSSLPLRTLRLTRLALHVIWGVATVTIGFRLVTDRKRLWLKQRWSRQLLDIVGVRLDAHLAGAEPGSMIVANHISWLDIFALNAARPVAFISKAEVRQWPVIGMISARADTVFLQRGSRGHAKIVNGQIDELLRADKDVAVFPEGTTTDGTHLLGFHAALLQPAIAAGRPLQPVAISYHEADGQRSLAPAYVGDTSLMQCLLAIISRRELIVRVRPTPALATDGRNRRELAHTARAAIAYRLALPLEMRASEADAAPASDTAGSNTPQTISNENSVENPLAQS